jgi:hypothetical protein
MFGGTFPRLSAHRATRHPSRSRAALLCHEAPERSCFILLYLANSLKRLIAAQRCFRFVGRELDS